MQRGVTSTWREFLAVYACPKDKHTLRIKDTHLVCDECGGQYPTTSGYPDFRLQSFVDSNRMKDWRQSQEAYEGSELYVNVETEMANLRGCCEIYKRLPPLVGRFLDVGGGYGLVRYFLSSETEYLCLDPWPGALIQAHRLAQDNLYSKSFPFIGNSFAFVCGHGESLPLLPRTFDWIHMRSVMDHFANPHEALNEAQRVMRPNGYLVIGVAALGGPSDSHILDGTWKGLIAKARFKYHQEGLRGLFCSAKRHLFSLKFKDDHMWHPSISQLRTLLEYSGFDIVWEHWTKPPYDHVIYILSKKKDG